MAAKLASRAGLPQLQRMSPANKSKPAKEVVLERVRRICGKLPETSEQIDGFGHRVFKVRSKTFAMANPEGYPPSLSIKSDPTTQAALIKRGGYVRTPYIGQHGWVSLDNPAQAKWAEVEELLIDAWRLAAPKTVAKKLE